MKFLVVMGSILLGMSAVLLTDLSDMLIAFIIAGHIPFTSLSVPPTIMLLFWILVVPATIGLSRGSNYILWRGVEAIGSISQRRINRQVRQATPIRHGSLAHLYVSALLHIANNIPKSTTNTPALEFRRRFLALPS